MDKQHILGEIKRMALTNGGRPLGRARFEQETGIKESHWSGKIWTKWNDAIEEAGFSPNAMVEAYSDEELLDPFVKFIRALGRFPTQPEQSLRRRQFKDFPPPSCIRKRWGTKGQVARVVVDYCLKIDGFTDVIDICLPFVTESASASEGGLRAGHVYLLKHDNAYKIGKSNDASRRYSEIKTQMPHNTEEIHVIETDDMDGIERYWHSRFSKQRLRGEWFTLSSDDVRSFKRRKYM